MQIVNTSGDDIKLPVHHIEEREARKRRGSCVHTNTAEGRSKEKQRERERVRSSLAKEGENEGKVRYVAIYGRLSRDKSLYMRPHRGGPLYETPSGAPHGITFIPLWSTYTVGEKSHYVATT